MLKASIKTFSFICAVYCSFFQLNAQIIDHEGIGYLEIKNQQSILHLKGTPYELGFQHGRLLEEGIHQNLARFIEGKVGPDQPNPRIREFFSALPKVMTHIPAHLIEEMHGVADGAKIPFEKILLLNLFPEMFHCAGVIVSGKATLDHQLYHVRVLDYAVGKKLQDTAVLMVVEPENGIPFLNVSYAGFIGSVTGMNLAKISIGEIGGLGYGYWDGIPMSLLLREVLEKASSLQEAIHLLEVTPRTCEYYYLIADGKTNESVGIYATASQLQIIKPGEPYAIIAPTTLPKNYGDDGRNDKFFLSPYVLEHSEYQTAVYQDAAKLKVVALFHRQPEECITMTGFQNPKRYPVLIERLMQKYGSLDLEGLKKAIQLPVTCETNLHNAIFAPADLKVWISHASPKGEAASDQVYESYFFAELLDSGLVGSHAP